MLDTAGAEFDGRDESDDNLKLTLLVKEVLENDYSISVVMTRMSDNYLENAERAEYAYDYNADTLISIHRNYYEEDEEVSGIEAWVHSQLLIRWWNL